MGRRKKGEDDTVIKDRLLDRIGRLYFTRGLSVYTMDEVSQVFHISKKTLYRFFPSKEDMIIQVARIFVSRIRAHAERIFKRAEKSSPDAFIPQITEFIGWIGSILLSMSPSILLDMEKKSPLLFERIDSLRREVIMNVFSRMLEAGKRIGKIRADIDVELAAHIYSGMIRQIASRQGIGPARAPYDVFLTAIKIMFEGVLTPESRSDFSAVALPRYSEGSPWDDLKGDAEN
jgi:AcrR family transcriptional regulator